MIFDALAAEAPELLAGEIEVDARYSGGHRKGKRGRGAAGKVPVFGLLKRQGKVAFQKFIKECEWRFNYRPIGRMLATLTRSWFK